MYYVYNGVPRRPFAHIEICITILNVLGCLSVRLCAERAIAKPPLFALIDKLIYPLYAALRFTAHKCMMQIAHSCSSM